MKRLLKKIFPSSWVLGYHYLISQAAALRYWYPSRKMIVIGVTGTNGKSTTVNLIGKILEEAGYKVGLISTVNIKIGDHERLNDLKMTMPGRFQLQGILKQMANAKCKYAIIETSSEGILQYRHLGVEYDVAVFTNLTPEHLESHGGFSGYKSAKLRLPALTAALDHKVFKQQRVKKIIVANLDDAHAPDFLNFNVDERWGYTIDIDKIAENISKLRLARAVKIEKWEVSTSGIRFVAGELDFNLKLLGIFDLFNAAISLSCALALEIPMPVIRRALEKVSGIPGRMEKVDEGQPYTILVDYSPEPASLGAVYKTLKHWDYAKIIHVLGSTGGGRDKQRRPILGYIAGSNADIVIVTNEDPYDDDPREIINSVAAGAQEASKELGTSLLKILDRREAIAKALKLAKPKDLVLITGKGSEQAMVVRHGVKIPWDDRTVVREELGKLK